VVRCLVLSRGLLWGRGLVAREGMSADSEEEMWCELRSRIKHGSQIVKASGTTINGLQLAPLRCTNSRSRCQPFNIDTNRFVEL